MFLYLKFTPSLQITRFSISRKNFVKMLKFHRNLFWPHCELVFTYRSLIGVFINVVVTSSLIWNHEMNSSDITLPTFEFKIFRFYFKETPKMLISKFKQVQLPIGFIYKNFYGKNYENKEFLIFKCWSEIAWVHF